MYWIDAEVCTRCLKCTEACTVPGAIVVRNGRPFIDVSFCTECGDCVKVCGSGAIIEPTASAVEVIPPAKTDVAEHKPAQPPMQRPEAPPPAKIDRGALTTAIVEIGGALVTGLAGLIRTFGESSGTGGGGRGSGRGMGRGAGRGQGRGLHRRRDRRSR